MESFRATTNGLWGEKKVDRGESLQSPVSKRQKLTVICFLSSLLVRQSLSKSICTTQDLQMGMFGCGALIQLCLYFYLPESSPVELSSMKEILSSNCTIKDHVVPSYQCNFWEA